MGLVDRMVASPRGRARHGLVCRALAEARPPSPLVRAHPLVLPAVRPQVVTWLGVGVGLGLGLRVRARGWLAAWRQAGCEAAAEREGHLAEI